MKTQGRLNAESPTPSGAARAKGADLEAHYAFVPWLIPTVERFPCNQKTPVWRSHPAYPTRRAGVADRGDASFSHLQVSPVGNLTSQHFANICFNGLDFVPRERQNPLIERLTSMWEYLVPVPGLPNKPGPPQESQFHERYHLCSTKTTGDTVQSGARQPHSVECETTQESKTWKDGGN